MHRVQYVIYSMRGVVEWLISDTRPFLKCCKSCIARPNACINWLIVAFFALDHHVWRSG